MDKEQFKELLSKDGVSSPTLDQYVDFLFAMGEPENLGALDAVLVVVNNVGPTTTDLQRFVMGEKRGRFPNDGLVRNWLSFHFRRYDPVDGPPRFRKPEYFAGRRDPLFTWRYAQTALLDAVVLMVANRSFGRFPDTQISDSELESLVLLGASSDPECLALVNGLAPIGGQGSLVNSWSEASSQHLSVPEHMRKALLSAAGAITALEVLSRPWLAPETEAEALPVIGPPLKARVRPRQERGFGRPQGARPIDLPEGGQLLRFRTPANGSGVAGHDGEARQPEDARPIELFLAPLEELSSESANTNPDEESRRAFDFLRNERDWLLVRDRWNVLSTEETQRSLAGAIHYARKAIGRADQVGLRVGLQLLLIAVSATSVKQVEEFHLSTRDDAFASKDGVHVTPEGGLVRKIPSVNGRYQPAATELAFLRKVDSKFSLQLPSECTELLRKWIGMMSLDPSHGPLKLFPKLSKGRPDLSRRSATLRLATRVPRLSARRLRDVLPLELVADQNDITVAQFITGSELHLSPVGGSYYTARVCDLQTAYDRVMTSLGLTVQEHDQELEERRVGSMLCLTDQTVLRFTKSLSYGLNHLGPRVKAGTTDELVESHNRVTVHAGKLLEAALATRSAATIGRIMLRDVSLDSGWAVIADKVVDASHGARLLVLCPLAVNQIRAYLSHLKTLEESRRMPPQVRAYARAALAGKEPLFRFVSPKYGIEDYDRQSLRRHLPGWEWPGNVFRHRAATALREQGCSGDLVAAQLGHAEQGQLFGDDSPTRPRDFNSIVGAATDRWLRNDGWKIVKGLGQSPIKSSLPGRLGMSAGRLEATVARREKSRRPEQSVTMHQRHARQLPEIQNEVGTILEAFVAPLASSGHPCRLDAKCTAVLRSQVIAKHPRDPAWVEWGLEELHRQMLTGESQGRWVCADRRRVILNTIEPSPFAVGMLSEHDKILRLQTWYRRALPKALAVPPTGETLQGWLMLGLVIFDYVVDPHDLAAYPKSLGSLRGFRNLDDAVIVTMASVNDEPAQVALLRGTNAMLAARASRMPSPEMDDPIGWFEQWLDVTLPSDMKPLGGAILPCLQLAARVSSRFEMPGTLRALRHHSLKVFSLDPVRIGALIDDWPAATGSPNEVNLTALQEEVTSVAATNRTSVLEVRRLVSELKAILKSRTDYEQQQIDQERTARHLPPSTRESELAAFERKASLVSDLLTLLARYAQKLVTKGTHYKSSLAQSTIYGYVCGVADILTGLTPRRGFLTLDDVDYVTLYDEAVGHIKESSQARARKYLRFFHTYLEEYHGAQHVAASDLLRGEAQQVIVDANIVTDREYRHALDLLLAGDGRTATQEDHAEAIHYLKAARVTLVLMRRPGSRIGEVMGRVLNDLFMGEKSVLLFIHKTAYGTLKSRSSTRCVNMSEGITAQERSILEDWIDCQERMRGKVRGGKWPLFADLSGRGTPMKRHVIAMLVSYALRAATGMIDARPHWLRHAATCYEFNQIHIPCSDIEDRPASQSPSMSDGHRPAGTIWRRRDHARIRVRRGHSGFSTTVTSYGHTLLLGMGSDSAWDTQDYSDAELAAICGVSYDYLRKLRERLRRQGHPSRRLQIVLHQRQRVLMLEPTMASR